MGYETYSSRPQRYRVSAALPPIQAITWVELTRPPAAAVDRSNVTLGVPQ